MFAITTTVVSVTKPTSFHANEVAADVMDRALRSVNAIIARGAISFRRGPVKFHFSGNGGRTFAKDLSNSSKTHALLK